MNWVAIALYALACSLTCSLIAGGYVRVGSWSWWRYMWAETPRCGIFRNDRASRGGPDYKPGGRWGIYIVGFELGSRNPRDPLGCWLVDRGIWRW